MGIDNNINIQMTEIQENLIQQVDQSENNLWIGTIELLNDMNSRFQNLMQNVKEDHDSHLLSLEQQMEELDQIGLDKQTYALEWVKNCETHIQLIERNYQHQLLMPGKLKDLERIYQHSFQNAEIWII